MGLRGDYGELVAMRAAGVTSVANDAAELAGLFGIEGASVLDERRQTLNGRGLGASRRDLEGIGGRYEPAGTAEGTKALVARMPIR